MEMFVEEGYGCWIKKRLMVAISEVDSPPPSGRFNIGVVSLFRNGIVVSVLFPPLFTFILVKVTVNPTGIATRVMNRSKEPVYRSN